MLVGDVVDDKQFDPALGHLGADFFEPLLVLVARKRQFDHRFSPLDHQPGEAPRPPEVIHHCGGFNPAAIGQRSAWDRSCTASGTVTNYF